MSTNLSASEEKQLSFSFKALINKEFTSTAKKFYEEFGTNTINTNTTEVWSSIVSPTPATAVSAGVAKLYTDFILSPLQGYATEAFYFASGSGWTPGDQVDRPNINQNLLQRNFISDKYGSSYSAVLKENNGTVINPTDPIGWQFNYQTGILTIENPGGKTTPYKISVYQYTGQFLSQSLGAGSGFPFAGDAVISGSLLISSSAAEEPALTISGSTELVGSLDVEGVAASLLDGQVDLTSSITVTAAAKTANNRYSGGSSQAYYLDGIESPYIRFFPGKSYIFKYPASHPLRFYIDDSTGGVAGTQYTTGVSTPAANQVQIDVTENTPSILYYMCTSHAYMGNAAHMESSAVSASLAQTASYVAGANVDGAVANATNAATASALATNATGDNLTLTGNLSVAGTASFTNAENLTIKDKYILLASGSAGATDGGIVIEQAADGKGKLFAYDSTNNRWAVTSSFDPATAAGYDPDAYMPLIISGSIIADIPASYNQEGNMFVDSSNDSWIYTDKWSKIIVSGSAASFSSLAVAGNADVTGTLSLPNISNVSASIAALESSTGASGIFVQTGSKFNTTNDLEITGSLIVSSSTTIPIQASGQSINIGTPTDGGYTDGFFDTFTSATSLAQAIDEISEAFLDLAPAKAGTLGGTNLVLSNATAQTGKLAYNMTNFGYYNGFVGGSSISFTNDSAYNLSTANTGTRFRAGKYSDFNPSNVLNGGVSSSIEFRGGAASIDTHALSDGEGTTGKIELTSLAQYETFWMKANARIVQSIAADATGSYKYQILADNGAGSTNFTDLAFVGANGSTFNPTPTVSPGSIAGNASGQITSGSVTYRYMSGVPYLKTADFTIPMTAENMFLPVYQDSNVQYVSSTFFSSNPTGGTTGTDTPNYDDSLSNSQTISLKASVSSGVTSPSCTIKVFKPGHTAVESPSVTLSSTPVSSYATDPSATSGNTENFLDEGKRLEQDYSTSWTPNSSLSNGNAQVRNGVLVSPNAGGISPGSVNGGSGYTGFTGRQFYIRKYTGFTIGRVSGTYTFSASSISQISAWGSGGDLEAILIDTSLISGGGSPSAVWDLGLAANNSTTGAVPGNNSATIYGVAETTGNLTGNWTLGFIPSSVQATDLALVISLGANATGTVSSANITVS